MNHLQLAPGIDLYRGDCIEVMAELADLEVAADAVVADPPYGIALRSRKHRRIANDATPMPEQFVKPMVGLMKPDSGMLLFTREDVMFVWRDEMVEAGLTSEPSFIWDKMRLSTGDTGADLARQTETILVGHKGNPPLRRWVDHGRFFPDLDDVELDYRHEDNFWHIPAARDRRSLDGHPTPKPPKLMQRALLNYSDEGSVVLDPFMGGGPVGVAAVQLGRRYIGIELEEDYFHLAVTNIQRALAERLVIQRLAERMRDEQ